MKKVLIFLGLVLLCLFVGSVSAMSGNGDADNPWIITTPADLTALSGTGIAGYGVNKYYELGADIDMSGVSFTPIGTSSYQFSGHFDGKNHTISNLNISTYGKCNALFHTSATSSNFKNIVFQNCTLNGGLYTACLVGEYSSVQNDIENIHCINCKINSIGAYCGGIIGCIQSGINSTMTNCSVENSIITSRNNGVGSLIGVCDSYHRGSVYTIDRCTVNNVYVSSSSQYCGGIVGGLIDGLRYSNTLTITDCNVLKSTINGVSYIGGIYGGDDSGNNGVSVSDCTVSDCALIGTSYVSGEGN